MSFGARFVSCKINFENEGSSFKFASSKSIVNGKLFRKCHCSHIKAVKSNEYTYAQNASQQLRERSRNSE